MTDWSKVLEVFISGIIGVYLVMFLLQVVTQLSTRIINRLESRNRGAVQVPEPEQKIAVVKE